jgi:hypothetical protein
LITQNLAAESLQELLQLRLGEYLHRQLTPAWDASTQRWKQSWLQGDLAHVDRRSDTDESQVGDVVAALPYKVAMAFTNALHEGGTSRRRSRWPRALNSRLENAEWQLVASLSDFVPAFREAEREAWEYEGRIFDSAFAHGVLSGALRAKRLPIGLHDAVIAPGTVEFTVFVRPQRKTNLEAIRSAGQTLRFSAEVLSPSENGKPIVALTTTDGAPHGLSLLTGTAWRQNADVVGVAMHGKYADIADVFASRQGAVWLTDRSLPELRELEFRAPDFRAGPAIAL